MPDNFQLRLHEPDGTVEGPIDPSKRAGDKGYVYIGRSHQGRPTNHIGFRLGGNSLSYMSRIHCRIDVVGEELYLKDGNGSDSAHGTYLNGDKLQQGESRLLIINDRITFGGSDHPHLKNYSVTVVSESTITPRQLKTQEFRLDEVFRSACIITHGGVAFVQNSGVVSRFNADFSRILGRADDELRMSTPNFEKLFHNSEVARDLIKSAFLYTGSSHKAILTAISDNNEPIEIRANAVLMPDIGGAKYAQIVLSSQAKPKVLVSEPSSWQTSGIDFLRDYSKQHPILAFILIFAGVALAIILLLR